MRMDRPQFLVWRDAVLAAFQLLTRLPVPVKLIYTEAVFRRSVVFYPAAGAVIGLLLAGASVLLPSVVPTFPASALLLAFWVFLTGALHLDGLMDTADGILSNRPRERMLEIMKDSRVGAMGVVVCVLLLLLKLSALYAVIGGNRPAGAPLLLAAVPVWSRWFMAFAMRAWPYAGGSQGMGANYGGLKTRHLAACTLGACLAALLFAVVFPASGWFRLWALAGFPLAALLSGWWIAGRFNAKLGGLTGDTYGALNELIETFLLFLAIIL